MDRQLSMFARSRVAQMIPTVQGLHSLTVLLMSSMVRSILSQGLHASPNLLVDLQLQTRGRALTGCAIMARRPRARTMSPSTARAWIPSKAPSRSGSTIGWTLNPSKTISRTCLATPKPTLSASGTTIAPHPRRAKKPRMWMIQLMLGSCAFLEAIARPRY